MTRESCKAVFLDRDGVLNEDVHLIAKAGDLRVLDGVPEALRSLKDAGFLLIVVSNQPVVARGIIDEEEVKAVNGTLEALIQEAGGPAIDAFYFCPHHPNADVAEYRLACDCRKPRPGMIGKACREWGIDVSASYMIGDRITDVASGRNAGCMTIQVATGREDDAPIQGASEADLAVTADYRCAGLPAAADWILSR